MTEDEWLTCTHPDLMLRFLHSIEASRRKLRLFGCSCYPTIRQLGEDSRAISGVDVAQRFADGLASHAEKEKVRDSLMWIVQEDYESNLGIVTAAVAALNHNAETASWSLAMAEGCVTAGWHVDDWRSSRGSAEFLAMCDPIGVIARDTVRSVQCDRLRCIFGNPFRPPPPLPYAVLDWNDASVRRIAEGIYEERRMPEGMLDTSRLAILHDALLAAGWDNAELLVHCRSAGPHVRGCWPVDLILGKE